MIIAIGLGCRKNIGSEPIVELTRRCLRELGPCEPMGLFTIDEKRHEAGLWEAAHSLKLPLSFLSSEQLNNVDTRCVAHSALVYRIFGVGSIAEAAALAGAGEAAVLRMPKQIFRGVTLALASTQ